MFYNRPFFIIDLNFICFGLLFIKNAFRLFFWPENTVRKLNIISGYYALFLFGFTIKRAFYNEVATTYMKFLANIYDDFIYIIPLKYPA